MYFFLIASGLYFSFTFNSLMNNLLKYTPKVVEIVKQIRMDGQITSELYSQLPKIAFDYAIAEKSDALGVVGIDIDWEDIGNWQDAAKYLPEIRNKSNFIELEGHNNKVISTIKGRKIALVGVSNLVVVESEEGILVIDPQQAKEVKKVAEYYNQQDN